MKIAVMYDDSEGAESALRAALDVAVASNGTLLLVRAFRPRSDAGGVFADSPAEAGSVVVEGWQAQLDGRAAECAVPTEARVVAVERGEDTGPALVRAAREWEADILAIASRRATGLSGALLGSVAASVINSSYCPTLLVRL